MFPTRIHRLFTFAFLPLVMTACAAAPLVQIDENFDSDPGWEGINNRIVCEGGPTINQNFGWSPGDDGRGVVGGEIWSAITPATYGMPIGPFSLKDKLSASGKIYIKRMDERATIEYLCGAYFGFYNSTRQGWRPWSSMMLQVMGPRLKEKPGPKPESLISLIILPADWRSDGVSNDARIPIDGKWHDWSFLYEPEATLPDGTKRSRVTLQFDGAQPFVGFPETTNTREHPAVMDRFGFSNIQSYGQSCEIYFSDLVVNGRKIDLSKDPGWEGIGNRVAYQAFSFHGRQDYSYMATNRAGSAPGEIGGIFWGTETDDPIHGYYGDDIGKLSLDDPISFSGTACFIDGQPDSGMMIGYFNAKEKMVDLPRQKELRGFPPNQSMGIYLEGPSSIGKQMMGYCAPTQKLKSVIKNPPIFQPIRAKRKFSFSYDPKANNGIGRYTMTLDGKEYSVDLTSEQREAGATFDRFGVMNLRDGGKCVIIYFDDITYTAQRAADHKPVRNEQKFVKIPYPAGGRKF